MFGPEYPKINTMWKRDSRNIIVPWEWSCEEFAYLANCPWTWTEKVDGTNIRLHWNGEHVTIGGRTDKAQVPATLVDALRSQTQPELWRSIFGEAVDVTVYGEGYGDKIQSGGMYRADQTVIVFDVLVGSWWLQPTDVLDVATKLGLEMVPNMDVSSYLVTMVNSFAGGAEWSSRWPNATLEGVVGRPAVDLYNRRGERIVTKIKVKDFRDYERKKPENDPY